jgi:tetratricopeptide (TPR) repeat protein
VEGNVLSNLSSALRDQGRYQEALDRMYEALALRREQGEQAVSVGEDLRDLALTYLKVGDYQQARHYADEMMAVQQAADYSLTRTEYNLWAAARVYRACGEPERAAELLEEAYTHMEEAMRVIPDAATREAFRDIFFNREIRAAYETGIWPT